MNTTTGIVFNIQRFSVNDGPGIRTLVFFKGCPLKCIWCSNPESQKISKEVSYIKKICIKCQLCVKNCPQGALFFYKNNIFYSDKNCILCGKCVQLCPVNARKIEGKEYTVEELFKEVYKDIVFFKTSGGGVTISGGEPYSQYEFLNSFLKKCRKEGLNTAVETCGFVEWEKIKKTVDSIDLFLFDIKHMDTQIHKKLTGIDNALILNNLKNMLSLDLNLIIRFPLIPGFNDDKKNLNNICVFLKSINYKKEIHLLPYHRLGMNKYQHLGKSYKLNQLKPPGKEKISTVKEFFEKEGFAVKLFG